MRRKAVETFPRRRQKKCIADFVLFLAHFDVLVIRIQVVDS